MKFETKKAVKVMDSLVRIAKEKFPKNQGWTIESSIYDDGSFYASIFHNQVENTRIEYNHGQYSINNQNSEMMIKQIQHNIKVNQEILKDLKRKGRRPKRK